MKDVLLVDGYNIIGASTELKKLKEDDFAKARDSLIEQLAEYGGYTGYRIILVFDAHMVPGIEKKLQNHNVEVVYTKENETADERIEKLAIELNNVVTQVHVATSDFTEQWSVFGQGALRISARELLNEIKNVQRNIKKEVIKTNKKKTKARIPLSSEVAEIFEKWRRGKR